MILRLFDWFFGSSGYSEETVPIEIEYREKSKSTIFDRFSNGKITAEDAALESAASLNLTGEVFDEHCANVTKILKSDTSVKCPVCEEIGFFESKKSDVVTHFCEECNAFYIIRFNGDGNYQTELVRK